MFYDLEFASCKGTHKICEFGFVITDELFNVQTEGNFVINPNIEKKDWDYYAVKKILNRTIKDYEAGNKFDYYYNSICELFNSVDYVVGHSNACDAQGLNDECLRYRLDSIDHEFYDIKEFYKFLNNSHRNTSLENMLKELEIIGDFNNHDAQGDAYNTMVVLRTLLGKFNQSFDLLTKLVLSAHDISKDYKVESIERNKELRYLKQMNELNSNCIEKGNGNWARMIKFLDEVKPTSEGKGLFKDKKISISLNYENTHFRQIINLIQLIVNEGGTYIKRASDADIFVKYDKVLEDGSIAECSKLKHVLEFNETSEKKIEIIDFKDLLATLELTEDKLDSMGYPETSLFTESIKLKQSKKHGKRKHKSKDTKDEQIVIDHLSNFLENVFKEYMNI